MWKFIQWSLATIVAVFLLAMVVNQILTASTGRARDVSVAVLKEKLARFDAERESSTPPSSHSMAVADETTADGPPIAAVDAEQLRAEWLAMLEQLEVLPVNCSFPKDAWLTSTDDVSDDSAEVYTTEVLEKLREYRDCLAPATTALLELLNKSGELEDLFDPVLLTKNLGYSDSLNYGQWLLNLRSLLDTELEDYEAAVDDYIGLTQLVGADSNRMYYGGFVPATIWLPLQSAIESGRVDDARWDRLLTRLARRRDPSFFFEQVRRQAEVLLYAFENWKTVHRDLKFTEEPVTFLRTWAYPRVTPALFNHDFDRFNRAVSELLDLSRSPFFEVKPALEQFCEDYDVEPGIRELKVTRANPGWYLVLYLSRHGIEINARRQAAIDVIRIAILLDRYHRETGVYPESLNMLAEQLGGSVPRNPLTGDDYVYERTEDSFRLGFRKETDPERMVEVGIEATTVTWWHDPFMVGPEVDNTVE